ncbi:hypothetical protein [Halobaculum limi]|uniref:hypothetical protein n=1 Tax=Halobaculum limi TaxID=3031916 RepID=UPI00240566EA|nr:hypothetical protein [Halobaculum sp. YSMS11]
MSSEGSNTTETDERGRLVNTGDGYERVDDAASVANESEEDDLGVRGWVLVGVVVFAFLVVPGIIYVRPTAPGELGFRFIAAMLVLPFLPALLLGLTAVWSLAVGNE